MINDSDLSLAEALVGSKASADILADLVLLDILYFGFDYKEHQGQIVVHEDLQAEVENIFTGLKSLKFLIDKVIPVVKYNWSDEHSMADNNSSGFNFRHIAGTDQLSKHAFGRAIDLNPMLNPYISREGRCIPPGSAYDPKLPGTILADSEVVRLFAKYGWIWGGAWGETRGYFDYHHFEKEV